MYGTKACGGRVDIYVYIIIHPSPHAFVCVCVYRGADKSLARPGRTQANVLSEWCEFRSATCLVGKSVLA